MRLMTNMANNQGLRDFMALSRRCTPSSEMTATMALTNLVFAAETGTYSEIGAAHDALRRLSHEDLGIRDRCLLLRCSAHALRIAGHDDEAVETAESAHELAQSNGLADAARMSGELLVHTHLDFERTAEAERWFEATIDLADGDFVATTLSAAMHMHDRLAFCSGKTHGLADRVVARLPAVKSIGHAQSRGSELALAAATLASTRRTMEAAEALSEAVSAAKAFVGRYAADMMLDYCLYAAAELGDLEAVSGIARTHVEERESIRGLRIPPAFHRLHALRDALPRG
jgi:hypothetical protein